MSDPSYVNFMGALIIAFVAPILASFVPRIRIPTIVLEFVLGVIFGPDVLGWLKVDDPLDILSILALSFLLFTAGTEVEVSSLRGPTFVRALVAFALSLAIALGLSSVLGAADLILTPGLIAIIFSATGLGAVIPILRGAGLTTSSVGQTILVVASVAEFGAVLLLSIFYGEGDSPVLDQLLFLAVFAVVTTVVWCLLRWAERQRGFQQRLDSLEGGTAQIRIRLAVLVLAIFLALSDRFGLETILGAFVAGIILGDLRRSEREEEGGFWTKIDGIGFGFLIPLYFVISGLRFKLDDLLSDTGALLRVPLFLVLFLVCRGVPAVVFRRQLGPRTTGALAFLSATSLSFVLTATDIGVRIGKLRDINATAIVGAAVIAMVVFPLIAQSLLPKQPTVGTGGVGEASPVPPAH
jgi:Kef-type K+ transport system membrane component KefB